MSEAKEVGYDYEGSGERFKIEVGKSAVLRFTGRPIAFEEVYEDKDTGEKSKNERFASTVIVRGNPDAVRGFKYSWQVFKALRDLAKKATWGDPSGYDVEIENTGKLPAYWKVTPVEKSPLSAADESLLAASSVDLRALYIGKKAVGEYDPFAQ